MSYNYCRCFEYGSAFYYVFLLYILQLMFFLCKVKLPHLKIFTPCYRLNLKCLSKALVLMDGSPAWHYCEAVETLRGRDWWEILGGGVALKGIVGPQSLPVFCSQPWSKWLCSDTFPLLDWLSHTQSSGPDHELKPPNLGTKINLSSS